MAKKSLSNKSKATKLAKHSKKGAKSKQTPNLAEYARRVSQQNAEAVAALQSKQLDAKAAQKEGLFSLVMRTLGWCAWVVAAYLMANILSAFILVGFKVHLDKLDTLGTAGVQLLVLAILLVITLGVPYLFSRGDKLTRTKAKLQAARQKMLGIIGLSRRPRLADIAKWAGVVVIYYVTIMTVSILATALLGQEIMSQAQDVGFAESGNSAWQIVVIFLVLAVLTPIVEELVMRGFLFGRLRQFLPFLVTAIIVSLLFALAHGSINVGIMTFVLSMFSCFLREKTGAIYGSILLHMTVNTVACVLRYLV